jgi:hypothetical protein
MIKTSLKTLALSGIAALALGVAQSNAQVLFEDDFNTGGTADAVSRGWEFVENEFVAEIGSYFIIAPEWPEGQDGPSTNTDSIFPPNADGTPSDGGFLIADSDAGDGSDDIGSESGIWALTPVFSTVGVSEVWMHADVDIVSNNNGECVFQFAATVDGGETWIPIWQCVEPERPIKGWDSGIDGAAFSGGYPELGSANEFLSFDGIHGRVHFPLPAAVVNQAEVRVRFGYYEPADAWWIAIDDLVIDTNPAPQGAETVLSEDFTNGIPAEWGNTAAMTQKWDVRCQWDEQFDGPVKEKDGLFIDIDLLKYAETEGYTIDLATEVDEFINPNGTLDGMWVLMLAGQGYAMWQEGMFEEDLDQGADLDTPALDLSDAVAVYMDFDSEVLIGNDSSLYEVFYSVDSGANFTRLFTYNEALTNDGETPYFTHHYFEVPEAAGKNSVIFRFSAKGADPNEMRGFWVVDNVSVTVDKGTPVTDWALF